jgi:hypothetical protein
MGFGGYRLQTVPCDVGNIDESKAAPCSGGDEKPEGGVAEKEAVLLIQYQVDPARRQMHL